MIQRWQIKVTLREGARTKEVLTFSDNEPSYDIVEKAILSAIEGWEFKQPYAYATVCKRYDLDIPKLQLP